MSGIPVVLSSRGFPVRSVDTDAPVMTVAPNGRGAPITLTERGHPFIIQGLDPDAFLALSTDEGDALADDDNELMETY